MKLLPYERQGVLNGHGGQSLTLWIISDPHYLSPSLFDKKAASFQNILALNNGKLIEAMPDIMAEFFSRARNEQPDAILIPGDLTLNGERRGLTELASELRALQAEGIRVFAIPGNHDIDCRYASVLTGDLVLPADGVSEEDFRRLIGPFGYDNGISRAPDSFSWIAPVSDGLRIMGLDSNTPQLPGGITEPTLRWAEEQLEAAKNAGVSVITMTHHNVHVQSRFMEKGFVLKNRKETAALLQRQDVKLNISGHIHLQHCAREDGLTDITVESASVFPLGFAVLTIGEGHHTWHFRKEYFETHQDAALQRMHETVDNYLAETLEGLERPEEETERLRKTGREACIAMFAGWNYTPSDSEAALGAKLWKTAGNDTFWGSYIVSAINNEHVKESR